MHHFDYRHGRLFAEDVDLQALAQDEGTPCYVYSTATLERHYKVFDAALEGSDRRICFALKANSNQAVIATLAKLGAGADVVSAGEMMRALAAGIPPEKIVFSGVGKSESEMDPIFGRKGKLIDDICNLITGWHSTIHSRRRLVAAQHLQKYGNYWVNTRSCYPYYFS